MNPRSILTALLISLFVTTGCSGKGAVVIAVVHIPDPRVESAIRDKIDKPTGDLLPGDLASVTVLFISNVTNLEGIQNCVFMEELHITHSDGINLSPLQYLPYLTYLRIYGCNDININPIGEIRTLDKLSLYDCEISDISPLEGLINLTGIAIYRNEISDISPLRHMTNLEIARLSSNNISNLEPLEGLTKLRSLSLNVNNIVDIEPLKFLINLNSLDLQYNQIEDLAGLIDNPGLGDGLNPSIKPDEVNISYNPLSSTAIYEQIPVLEARGVNVYY
ncbi:leucine-rich repeat domain-containing protein [bacterium]|nr:leucine-rich repeat domain-containing protein [bacterium]